MDLNLRALIGRLDPTCHLALDKAAGNCLSRTHYNVELEHWLEKLNEDPNADLAKILRHFEISSDVLAKGLARALDRQKTGNSRAPSISPAIIDAIRDAWLVSSVDFGFAKIRSGTLLLAMLSDARSASQLRDACREIDRISAAQLRENFLDIVVGSSEEAESMPEWAAGPTPTAGGEAAVSPMRQTKTPALDQYTIDLTAAARAGKVDPVLGRDREIRQIVDILTRRRQNNPILTGEAGVGKTAVVEGFALRIAAGDVPPQLRNVTLRTLDLGLLQAGAGVKGEFENRLKSVISEVKNSPTPIILFIDEAHTMIGAGGQAGQGDAANLLKPALARGELRTIAATTWAEYKKYFEKDAALARRFQVVKVDEPAELTAIRMMRGLVEMLESHHDVSILDEAVEASVKLSARYISGRQLPDKSVSLLDTACARVGMSQHATPSAIEDRERQIMLLETERTILKREESTGSDHAERLAGVVKELETTKEELESLKDRWTKEQKLVQEIRDIRTRLRRYAVPHTSEAADAKVEAASAKPAPAKEQPRDELPPIASAEEAASERRRLDSLCQELEKLQGETPLLEPWVSAQTVAEVISAWTGIPAGRMVADQIQTVLRMKELLAERVVGQDHALEAISKRIQTSRANLDDPRKPIGVFLLVGPSGVGKTETAIAIADLLYGGERSLISINMSEYQESHTVSGLKGSPPGYVGYGEGGVLTEAVRRKPYSVVLLDEVEKAHSDVMELFFQVFDKGQLEDGEGREIDFKNTVILLTSNVGTDLIMEHCGDPENRPSPEDMVAGLRPELERFFPPALLGRLVVCGYYPLADDIMKRIIRLKLDKIVRRVAENQRVQLTYDDQLVEAVASRCEEAASGARAVDNILTNTLLPELSREFLTALAEGRTIRKAKAQVGDDGQFAFHFE